ncbi:tetratricopeptide repeat protein, partial [Aromatoleum toluclasticum]|nr:tetratricopeptide repeat protein [Aromatoleum toluclasticum]
MNGMAAMLGKLDGAKAAEPMLRQSVALHREVGGPFYLGHGLFTLAENLRDQGRHAEALEAMGQVLEIHAQHNNRIGMWWVYFTRSNYHEALHDLDAAMGDAEQADAIARNIGLPVYAARSLDRMAQIAAAQGDHRRAFELATQSAAVTREDEQVRIS